MICPKCGNNDVTDPEICPKCHSVLKVNNEKIGYKNQWSKSSYVIKKDKDVNTIKAAIMMIVIIIIIGGVIAFGIKYEVFSNTKTVELKDANIFFNNIDKYILYSKQEVELNGVITKPKYTINNKDYEYYDIPKNICILDNGIWNNSECEEFLNDMNNYCKLNNNSCVRTPDSLNISFDNDIIKNGSTITYDNITCTYHNKNIKCIQKK